MNEYGVLTNRRRTLIALAHSLFFLALAVRGFDSPKAAFKLHGSSLDLGVGLVILYTTVISILVWLITISGCRPERMYFRLCAASATLGLLRTCFGDAALPAAQFLRILMLICAVVTGTWILHSYNPPPAIPNPSSRNSLFHRRRTAQA
jgi:hypothetical protein